MTKRGPKTEAGKEVVSANAVQHGILASRAVVRGLESEEEWQSYRSGMLASMYPVGYLESELSERVVALAWRLRRVVAYESHTIAASQDRIGDDLASGRAGDFWPATIEEADQGIDVAKNVSVALHMLPGANSRKKVDAEDVEWFMQYATQGIDVELSDIEPPEFLVSWEDVPSFDWNGELFHRLVAALAAQLDRDPQELVQDVQDEAERDIEHADQRRQRLQRKFESMRRERLLPDEAVLNKVVRYEAHLNRQFVQALHELEAIQALRSGGQAPLARVDIQVNKDEAS